MKWYEKPIELLPTEWSRWTAGSTILLSIAAYNLPSLLPLSGQTTQPLTLFLMKLLLSILVLLFGALLVLLMVVRHSNSLQVLVDNQEQIHEAKIAEIKAATEPINNLKPGEALITENLWSGNPVTRKINFPS